MAKFLTNCGTLATIGSLLLASKHVNAQDYSELPDGVVHFPLTRVSQDTTKVIYKRDSNNDTVDVTLANEVAYFATNLQIGSNEQNVSVQIDTGSSDLWVMNASNPYCFGTDSDISSSDRINCTSDLMFDSSSSSTFHSNQTSFSITYGDTTFANGTYASDTVIVGGKKVSNANFALATLSNSSTTVFGIGLMNGEASVDKINSDGSVSPTYNNIPVQMKEQGIISHIGYSLWLNGLDSQDGNLLFGGVDHAKYQGSLQKVPVVSTTEGVDPYSLSITLGNISLYQGAQSAVLADMSLPALLDSGSSFMSLPTVALSSILASVGGRYSESESYIPCDSTGGLTFNIGGIEIQVPFSEIVIPVSDESSFCLLEIDANDDQLILGDPFLRNVYAVYDLENLEVAFAPTLFNSSDSNVEAIVSNIPSASQAPYYSSTQFTSLILTRTATFYKTGTAGANYGNYPSGYTETTTGPAQETGAQETGDKTTSPEDTVASTGTATSTGTHATATSTATHATSTSSASTSTSSSKSKNGAVRNGAGVGILGALAGGVFMLL